MSNDPAYILAQRAFALYPLSPRATFPELLAICRERGIAVTIDSEIDREGWFTKYRNPETGVWRPLIVLRRRRRRILAHELFHAWITENIEAGITYAYSDYADDDVEAAANRFACLVCGDFGERMQAVLMF